MAITPQTNIKLLKVPIEISNKNQLTFSNANAQYTYFNSLPKYEIESCSYQRKDNILRFPAHIDSILHYNYCMYQNSNYNGKWFYAFIENMEYENDGLTNITLKTDVFQTWQFDLHYKPCYVEREHVNNDTIGLHTIPENLDVGEVVEERESEDVSLSDFPWVAIASSWNPSTGKQFAGITCYNNQIFGTQIHLIKATPISNLANLIGYLFKTNSDGHTQDINNIFIVPSALINENELTAHSGTAGEVAFTFYTLPYNDDIESFSQNFSKQHSFTGFSPKNNKCFVYPYNYLLVSNNIGNKNIYKYENFSGSNVTFDVQLAISVGCSGRLVPKNYKGKIQDDDEALPLGKFPTCGWSTDAYTNWLTQNSVNMPLSIFNSIMAPIQGIMGGGNAVDITSNTLNKIGSTINSFYEASLLPNIDGVQNTGDVNYSAKRNTFTFRFMRCKNEYLQTIDDFFSMFGYKVNNVKVPNITGRQNWNYVKTIDCNITADIPQMDLQEIVTMFDNGITLWHNSSTFLDYSQSNSII